MSEDKFWTDELVKEFVDSLVFFGDKEFAINKFKQSKQQSNKEWEILETTNYSKKIVSVKRLSDNELFTIGDKVDYGKPCNIIRLFISSNGLMWCDVKFDSGNEQHNVNILSLDKATQPLFKTEDGKDIYEGDEYWFLHGWNAAIAKAYNGCTTGDREGIKYFSSKEKADEYILSNKPMLSLNDLLSVWAEGDVSPKTKDVYAKSPLFNSFKILAQSKIKQ